MRTGARKSLVLVAALTLAALAAGVAWASIPDGTGTIHACYSPSDKTLRVIDTGGCAKGETPVSWGQNAIQGAQGSQGNPGPPGATGLQGPAGLTLASGVNDFAVNDPVIGGFFKELTCPSGTKALEGTWDWWGLDGSTKMDQPDVLSFPIGDDSWGFADGADSTWAGEPISVHLSCVYAR
jgi:hypothetical protein